MFPFTETRYRKDGEIENIDSSKDIISEMVKLVEWENGVKRNKNNPFFIYGLWLGTSYFFNLLPQSVI